MVIGGSDFDVEPRSHPLSVPHHGDTGPIFFSLTPLRAYTLELRISFYLARELALLQEFQIPIEVREAAKAA